MSTLLGFLLQHETQEPSQLTQARRLAVTGPFLQCRHTLRQRVGGTPGNAVESHASNPTLRDQILILVTVV